MNTKLLAAAVAASLLSAPVLASSNWTSHVLGAPIPESKVIPNLDPIGTWAFQNITKVSVQNQDWNGNDKNGVTVDFRPRIFGYYEITDQLRFSADIWMKYKTGNNTNEVLNMGGQWEHLQVGFEHETLGAITAGAHATIWGGTVMDMHNALGMMDLQGNPKTGDKLFYINDFGADNDLYIRAMRNWDTDEWGTTIGMQNYSSYAARMPVQTYGIYFDMSTETYMSQSGDAGGGKKHNTDNDITYALSGFYGNGKGTYLAAYAAYADDEGVDYEDQPSGFGPDGNPYGQGLSASVMARHTFSNGFEPLVSLGTGGDGQYMIVDLAYKVNKHVRPYLVTKVSTDDEAQVVAGVRFDF